MVIILVLLLTVAILSACISSSDNGDISIDSAVPSDVSVEYAATTIVKTQEIDDAVDPTVETMTVVPTETSTPAVAPTVVIETIATSTVTESTGTVTPTASVVVQVAKPTSIETVIATAAVKPTTVPSPVPVPTPIPNMKPTPTPNIKPTPTPNMTPTPTPNMTPTPTMRPTATPQSVKIQFREGIYKIPYSFEYFELKRFRIENVKELNASGGVSAFVKWGDINEWFEVPIDVDTGEILAGHLYRSGGTFPVDMKITTESGELFLHSFSVFVNGPVTVNQVTPTPSPTPVITTSSNATSIVETLNSRSSSDAIDPFIKYSPAAGEKIVDKSILNQYSQNNYIHFDSFDFHGEYQGNNAQELIPIPDPTDTVSLPSNFPILGNVFTIEVQVYSSAQVNMPHRTIIGNDANPSGREKDRPPTITLNKVNGVNQIRYGFGIGPDSKGKRRIVNTDMVEDQWYHIAFTFNGTTTKLFLDGIEIDSSNFASGLTPHPVPISIIGRKFLGKIDEVRIWNIARTEQAIQSTLTSELIGNEPGLIAYYPMNVNQDWELIDKGPNNHHAIITNVEIMQRYSSSDCPNPNGTLTCPYPTIRDALDTAQAGDGIFIKDGRYPEVIFKELFNQSYETNGPKITLRGESANVILDGTVPLTANWELVDGRYEASVDMYQLSNAANVKVEDIHGLWVDERYMIPAMPVNFTNPTDVSIGTQNNPEIGTIFEKNLTAPYEYPGMVQDPYVVGDINNLDAAEEWSFDKINNKLYLIPGNKIPNTTNVRVRVRTKLINFEFSDNLEFKNFHVFAGSFSFFKCSFILLENSKFSHSWEVGINYIRPGAAGWDRANYIKGGTNNIVRNSIFEYINDAFALQFWSSMNPLAENILFQYNDWFKNTVWAPGANDNFTGGNKWYDNTSVIKGSTFRYVTMDQNQTGGLQPGLESLVEYARIQNQYINIDGGGIQRTVGNVINSTTRYSWLLDTNRNGMRLDSKCGGTDAVIHHVVSAGNKRAFRLKGDRHRALHLLAYDTNQNDISMPKNKYCGEDWGNHDGVNSENMLGNFNSQLLNSVAQKNLDWHMLDIDNPNVTVQNLSNEFLLNQNGIWYGRTLDEDKIPPFTYPHFALQDPWVENRYRSNESLEAQFGLNPFINGVQGFDFRPRKGSTLIDGGVVIPGINNGQDIDPSNPANHPSSYSGQHRTFVGDAPDIGAYEYGDSVYWIPGFRYYYPTVPIPSDGATDVPIEYGLAFNYPWKTDYSNIIAQVTINGPGVNKTVSLNYPNNVVFETFLPGQAYNWSVTVDGVSSNTWSFTVANKIHPLNDRSVNINAEDEKIIPNHNKSLSLSDGVLSFLKFDIPSSIDSDYQMFLNLTPETLTSLNGQIMLYKYNYQGWGENLDNNNIGILDHNLLTSLKGISQINPSSSLSINITDYIDATGEVSFALGVVNPNDQLSFYSKEKMFTDGVDIYVEPGDLLGPSGNGSGYAPQIDVWPSISFVKNN